MGRGERSEIKILLLIFPERSHENCDGILQNTMCTHTHPTHNTQTRTLTHAIKVHTHTDRQNFISILEILYRPASLGYQMKRQFIFLKK